jgi:hypothetical protein
MRCALKIQERVGILNLPNPRQQLLAMSAEFRLQCDGQRLAKKPPM